MINSVDIAVIIADIIAKGLNIPPDRVAVYDGNWKAPKDKHVYATVSLLSSRPVSVVHELDRDENEVESVTVYDTFAIDLVSQNTEAMELYPFCVATLTGDYARRRMEQNTIAIWRDGDVQDLSYIEGASALHRYRINTIVSSVRTRTASVPTFDAFPREVKVEE